MKKTAVAAAAGVAAVGTAAGKFTYDVYRYMMCREAGEFITRLLDIGDHGAEYLAHRDAMEAALLARPCIHLTAESPRGEKLAGYYYPCGDKPCGRIVFMVHGFRTSYSRNAGIYYDFFTSRGFDIFCCDNVAHGRSGGRYMGYDYFESEDCLHWIDCLKHCFGENIKILLHGQSLGGATVAKMSDRVPDNVKFIVDDCGFTSAVDTLGRKTGAAYPIFAFLTSLNAGYDLRDTNVRENVKNALVPMLFVHGDADPAVPFSMGQELYALCGAEKDCLFVEGAKHVESIFLAPEEYGRKIDQFVAKYF